DRSPPGWRGGAGGAGRQGGSGPRVFSNWPEAWPYRPDTPPVAAGAAMVATTDRYATEVGLEVMRAGGNAIDAAVAVSFALAVVNPEAGNIGGGGYLVLRMADGTA